MSTQPTTFDENEREWILRRILEKIEDVNENPVNEKLDQEVMQFLIGMRDKLRNAAPPTTFAIPGLPEGWEAARWDIPLIGDYFLIPVGGVQVAEVNHKAPRLIVRRVESAKPLLTQEMVDRAQAMDDGEPCGAGGSPTNPVCTWPRGYFKDGWLAEDSSRDLYWFYDKPTAGRMGWIGPYVFCETCFLEKPITFNPDLPWNQRIVKVGPDAEREMK